MKNKMKKTIVFDFDGVIHQGYKGYKDGSIYGTINYELLDYMKELLKEYYIVISSNRPAKQIVEYMNINTDLEFEIFNKNEKNLYWEKDDVIGVTNEKAIGILYIDDRGLKYNKNKTPKSNIKNIKMVLKNKPINDELIDFLKDKIKENEDYIKKLDYDEVEYSDLIRTETLKEVLDFVNKGDE